MNAHAASDTVGRRRAMLLRILGLVIAVTAVAVCVRTLVLEWPQISGSLASADLRWIAGGVACAVVGMWFLAVLWHRCLAVFGSPTALSSTTAWFFAGELGKYLPGGIWPVVGRGELAHRGGVSRSVAYTTTLLSAGLMCVGGAIACVLFTPFLFGDGLHLGPELLILLILPIGLVLVHPAVFGPILRAVDRASKGRVSLAAPPWGRMVGLILVAVPTWVLIGASSALVTQGLGFDQQPGRVAFAAVAAWIVGFLCIPVPAGAGVRELVFVLVSGLAAGPAVAVAALSRVMFVAIDAVAGTASLLWLRTGRQTASADRSVVVADQ